MRLRSEWARIPGLKEPEHSGPRVAIIASPPSELLREATAKEPSSRKLEPQQA